VVIQVVHVSAGQRINITVGSGGSRSGFNVGVRATAGQDTVVSVSGTTVNASGGGLGGNRDYNYSNSPGGAGGCGGGGPVEDAR
jgi:hypothetical protein